MEKENKYLLFQIGFILTLLGGFLTLFTGINGITKIYPKALVGVILPFYSQINDFELGIVGFICGIFIIISAFLTLTKKIVTVSRMRFPSINCDVFLGSPISTFSAMIAIFFGQGYWIGPFMCFFAEFLFWKYITEDFDFQLQRIS